MLHACMYVCIYAFFVVCKDEFILIRMHMFYSYTDGNVLFLYGCKCLILIRMQMLYFYTDGNILFLYGWKCFIFIRMQMYVQNVREVQELFHMPDTVS
jgi:hypothetical protein